MVEVMTYNAKSAISGNVLIVIVSSNLMFEKWLLEHQKMHHMHHVSLYETHFAMSQFPDSRPTTKLSFGNKLSFQ